MKTKKMKTFYLTEICQELWDYDYAIEAETLEEAKEKLVGGEVDPIDSMCHESESLNVIESE